MLGLMLTTALSVHGAWFKPCEETPNHSFIRQELHVSDGQWVRDTKYNSQRDCTGQDFMALRQIFNLDADEPRLDLQTVATSYEPLTAEAVALLNETKYCGFTDWKVHVSKDVTGLKCGETRFPEKGHMIYSIFRLQPRSQRDLLWVGEETSGADGATPENRHLSFELYAFERQDRGGLK